MNLPEGMEEISKTISPDKFKIEQAAANPKGKIFYFKHNEKPLGYILMSNRIDRAAFFQLFPNTKQISKLRLDLSLFFNKEFSVVFVGDDGVIDEHFNDETNG